MQSIELFESLAIATWERMRDGEELNCAQGEETITDLNLLEMKRANLPDVRIRKFKRIDEAKTGLDWEWWIGSDHTGWWRYAVQAKKLDKSRKYSTLRYKVKGEFQIELLQRYAKANGCIPLYCFYNYAPKQNNLPHWNCNLRYDEPQLGCTVSPLDVVMQAFQSHCPKGFTDLHFLNRSLPWRCLVKCPAIINPSGSESHPLDSVGYENTRIPELPGFLRERTLIGTEVSGFSDHYQREIGIYPRRILIVNTNPPNPHDLG